MREYAHGDFSPPGGSSVEFDEAIRERHWTRRFLPQPVPRELLNEALALAQYAPSNSNIQPWHMVFASGASRDRLVAALIDEAQRRPPNIPPLPASFQHFRSELGAQVYGAMGIARETRRDMQLQCCATGNFSARQSPVLFACTATSARRTPSV